jgi:general secretion pathway protein M
MKDWWARLAEREQRAIMVGGALLMVFIAYEFIWASMLNHVNQMRLKVHSEQTLLQWMRTTNSNIQMMSGRSSSQTGTVSSVTLLSFLQKQLTQMNLQSSLQELKQTSQDMIEVRFQRVEFDRLMQFIIAAVNAQPLSISQLSIVAENDPGLVNAAIGFRFHA